MGALLFAILTGKPPFEGRKRQEIIEKVLTGEAATAVDLEPDAPPELSAICAKAMTHEPEGRNFFLPYAQRW